MRSTRPSRARLASIRRVLILTVSGLLLSSGWAAAAPADPIPSGTVELTAPSTPDSAYTPGALADPDPSQRVTWSLQPSTADGPDGRVSFRHQIDPGAVISDFVTIGNFADREVTFALYASDGVTTPDGVFDLLPGGVAPTDGGSWITLDQQQVTVPAQSSATVPFSITVPADATPGDHPAGIVAALTTNSADAAAGTVSMERRVGARVHLRVAGDITPMIEVQNLSADFSGEWGLTEGGSTAVQMDLVNTGNVRLQGDAQLVINGPLGVWSRTIELGAVPEILPNNQIHVTAQVDNVPPLILLTHTATIELAAVGTDDVGPLPAPTSQDTRASAMPWLWALIVLGLVALIAYLVQSRSRARRKLAFAVAEARAAGEAAAGGGAAGGAAAGGAADVAAGRAEDSQARTEYARGGDASGGESGGDGGDGAGADRVAEEGRLVSAPSAQFGPSQHRF